MSSYITIEWKVIIDIWYNNTQGSEAVVIYLFIINLALRFFGRHLIWLFIWYPGDSPMKSYPLLSTKIASVRSVTPPKIENQHYTKCGSIWWNMWYSQHVSTINLALFWGSPVFCLRMLPSFGCDFLRNHPSEACQQIPFTLWALWQLETKWTE